MQMNDPLFYVEDSGYRVSVVVKSGVSVHDSSTLVTVVARYPRIFAHSQFLTHRSFSRNSTSNRAMGFKRCLEEVRNDLAGPITWQRDKRGMVGGDELSPEEVAFCQSMWKGAAEDACRRAEYLHGAGVHHQVVNRLIEPYQWITTVMTNTLGGWKAFWGLRCDDDAQPELKHLARLTRTAVLESPYSELIAGWHVPFVGRNDYSFWCSVGDSLGVWPYECRLLASAGRCARVSYARLDRDDCSVDHAIEDIQLAQSLIKKGHWSPFEHQARVVDSGSLGLLRNLDGWVQQRAILEVENSYGT